MFKEEQEKLKEIEKVKKEEEIRLAAEEKEKVETSRKGINLIVEN